MYCIACGLPSDEAMTNDISNFVCPVCTSNGTQKPVFSDIVYARAVSLLNEKTNQDLTNLIEHASRLVNQLPYWKDKKATLPSPNELKDTYRLYSLSQAMKNLTIADEFLRAPDFFISHSWEGPEEELVEPLVKSLKSWGYNIWYDKDTWLTQGGEKDEWMKRGITQARHCLAILCRSYFNSEACMYELDMMRSTKQAGTLFFIWAPDTNEEYKKEKKGNHSLPATVIEPSDWQGQIDLLVNKLVLLANEAEGLQEYNGVPLISDEARVLKQLESSIQEPLPALMQDELSGATFGFYAEDHHIVVLFLESKGLKRLPRSIKQCTMLNTLKLRRNRLIQIPTNLTALQNLDLEQNQLRSLPTTISGLVNLRNLNLRTNELTSLPESFTQLVDLEDLNLGWNKLKNLPETIGNLKKLKYLSLRSNFLTDIPKSMENLSNLRKLYLMGNPMTIPPFFIEKLNSQGCKVYHA